MEAALLMGQPHSLRAADDFYTSPPIPREGEPFSVVYESSDERMAGVTMKVFRSDGTLVKEGQVSMSQDRSASLSLSIEKNGMYKAIVEKGGADRSLDFPVTSKKREINIIYYGITKELWEKSAPRWVTLNTSTPKEILPAFKKRQIVSLGWSYGSNLLGDTEKKLAQEGQKLSSDICRDTASAYFSKSIAATVKEGFEGWGMDEFGGYPGSPNYRNAIHFVEGLRKVSKDLPKGFKTLAWHAGPIGEELMWKYKETVDYLVVESYMLECVPTQLGTEDIVKDLEGRVQLARGMDMFTAPYDTKCKFLLSVDLNEKIPTYEYESFLRMVREEFPEIRGIAFFGGFKPEAPENRIIDQMCFDFYVKPVLTLRKNGLSYDSYFSRKVVCVISNVGGMDSGKAVVRLSVDGAVVESKEAAAVPAGFSRFDNIASVAFDWQPEKKGVYRIKAELVDAAGATVLTPAQDVSIYIDPEAREQKAF